MKEFQVTKVTTVIERIYISSDNWESAESLAQNAQNWETIDYRESIAAEDIE